MTRLRQAVGNYAGLPPKSALENSVLRELQSVWEVEYSDAGFTWPEVQASLKDAVNPTEVISVNRRGSGVLDYSRRNYRADSSSLAYPPLLLVRSSPTPD